MSAYESIRDGLGFFDFWNVVFVVGGVGVGGAISYYDAPASVAVALFTAVYALVAFNRMRDGGPARSETSVIRPVYEYDSKSDTYDFGLKNFGDGPAFELRVHARVEDGSASEVIGQNEKPLCLAEGEFASVLRGPLAELRDEASPLYDATGNADGEGDENADGDAEVKLYYTWESRTGAQYPIGQDRPHAGSMEPVIENADGSKRGPRSVTLADVQERCAKKQYAVNST